MILTEPSLEILPIELPRDAGICVHFRRDAYACSFNDADRFERECGKEGKFYIEWLTNRKREFLPGFVHLWREGEIIGQVEVFPRTGLRGFISLFYLVPSFRGSGISRVLDEYVRSVAVGLGLEKLELCVSPLNARAVGFYRKNGWRDMGPHPVHDGIHSMELLLR